MKEFAISFELEINENPELLDVILSPENKILKRNVIKCIKKENSLFVLFTGNEKLSSARNTVDDLIKTAIIGINVKKQINRNQ